jgi:hypothetical protein
MSEPEPHPEQPVLTERRERTLVITLNRPRQRNAIDAAVAHAVAAALDELDADPALPGQRRARPQARPRQPPRPTPVEAGVPMSQGSERTADGYAVV